jgi:hypothetical protein
MLHVLLSPMTANSPGKNGVCVPGFPGKKQDACPGESASRRRASGCRAKGPDIRQMTDRQGYKFYSKWLTSQGA